MGPKTSGNGQIQKREAAPEDRLVGLLQRMAPQIQNALPKHLDPDRMVRIALTALRTVRDLGSCDAASFAGCVMQSAQLGLEVNTPMQQAWLSPRRNRGDMQCTLIVGYQGYIDLAMRSGRVTGIYAFVVREGDDFRCTLGLNPDIHHVPSADADRESRPITYVYAVAKIKNGEPIFVCLSRAQVEQRRSRSDGYTYQVKKGGKANPWFTDEEAMFQKTAVRALWKWLPKSAEMAKLDAYETAAERGSQGEGFDPDVLDALQKQGLDVPIDAEGEEVDPETGEVKPTREPGDEGDGELTAEQEAAVFGGGQ